MSENYRVIFTGQIEPGRDLEQVIDRFSEKFKLDRAVAEKVIRAGRPVSLKKELPLDKAEKYLAVLQHIGILVEIDPKPPEPEPEPAAPPALELEPLDHGGGDTTEVLEHVPGVDTCPKCGSRNMEMGICQDCGIVAAKFLAAQAERGDEEAPAGGTPAGRADPYTAPEAELETPQEGEMNGPHAVPALSGLGWLAQGWDHFKSSPMWWTLAFIVWILLSFVIGLVPFFLGGIALLLISPVIMAGFMLGCQEQEQGGDFTLGHLFAGFSNNAGQLILVGLIYMAMSFLASIVMGVGMAVTMGSIAAMDPENVQMMAASVGPPMLLFMLLFIVVFLGIMMTYIFAPALVALDGLDALNAMKLSFRGCWRNLLPLFIYGVIGTLISLLIFVPMVLAIFEMIPFWLHMLLVFAMMLVMFPWFTASVYTAYRDIYFS